MSNIYKVENPIYMDYKEMWKHYEENMVVITEAVWEEHPLRFIGGVVRYYGDDNLKRRLFTVSPECSKTRNADKYYTISLTFCQ